MITIAGGILLAVLAICVILPVCLIVIFGTLIGICKLIALPFELFEEARRARWNRHMANLPDESPIKAGWRRMKERGDL